MPGQCQVVARSPPFQTSDTLGVAIHQRNCLRDCHCRFRRHCNAMHCNCHCLLIENKETGKYIFIRPDYSTDTRFPPHTIQEWGGDIFRRSYLERQDFGKQMRPPVKNRRGGVDSLESLQKVFITFYNFCNSDQILFLLLTNTCRVRLK